jgi:hypothetical protein
MYNQAASGLGSFHRKKERIKRQLYGILVPGDAPWDVPVCDDAKSGTVRAFEDKPGLFAQSRKPDQAISHLSKAFYKCTDKCDNGICPAQVLALFGENLTIKHTIFNEIT